MRGDLAQRLTDPGAFKTTGSKLRMVALLTWPAILAQMSNIVMEYIDAAMVGSLGATQAAAIGLVATSTWLTWGLCVAICTGFAVQIAHHVGAGDDTGARRILRQGMVAALICGLVIGAVSVAIAGPLPFWLGGGDSIAGDASAYFAIFSGGTPLLILTFLSVSILRSSGNMVVPGVVNIAMCLMDVVFNFLLIFPTRRLTVAGLTFTMPGAGLGVSGAAVGTLLAYTIGGIYLYTYIFRRSQRLSHPYRGISLRQRFAVSRDVVARAVTIGWPVALERIVMCGAMILITTIVAPLGNAAIAANAFAVTAESLCYAPGYGVSDAATTLVGQSLGAGRKILAKSFARICVAAGMLVMGVLGAVMWLLAPEMMSIFSTDPDVLALGTVALRTEAWAEPMFGAAIVTYGVFVGAGYTKVPAVINFGSVWLVRITLSAILAPKYGLYGVWLAMCIELCVRGAVFLIALTGKSWIEHFKPVDRTVAAELNADPPQDDTGMVM